MQEPCELGAATQRQFRLAVYARVAVRVRVVYISRVFGAVRTRWPIRTGAEGQGGVYGENGGVLFFHTPIDTHVASPATHREERVQVPRRAEARNTVLTREKMMSRVDGMPRADLRTHARHTSGRARPRTQVTQRQPLCDKTG